MGFPEHPESTGIDAASEAPQTTSSAIREVLGSEARLGAPLEHKVTRQVIGCRTATEEALQLQVKLQQLSNARAAGMVSLEALEQRFLKLLPPQ